MWIKSDSLSFEDYLISFYSAGNGWPASVGGGWPRFNDIYAQAGVGPSNGYLDDRNGEAVLAIDRTGTRPIYYCVTGTKLVFGSTLDAISVHPTARLGLNHQAIFDYVYFHMVPAPQTIRDGCRRLLPGSFLVWRNGKCAARPYWQMRYTENARPPFAELKHNFQGLLRDSVREAAGLLL